ncbi:MAG TPA: hypothetical protein VF740_07635, partial [Candidatus Acidoferrum sp.]
MATPLQDFRTKYPQYGDMNDQQLADSLYNKYYSDMPRATFDQRMGIAAPDETPARSKFEESPAGKVTAAVGGVLDVGRAAATGTAASAVGGLMGGATLLTNAMGATHDDPVEMIRKWQAKAYTPETRAGQRIAEVVGGIGEKTVGAVGKALGEHIFNVTGSALEATMAELMPDVLTTITGAKVPAQFKEMAMNGAAKITRDAMLNQNRTAAVRTTRQAGFKVSPAEYGGSVGRTITSASNRAEIAREISAHNEGRVVELFKANMELPPEAAVDRATFSGLRTRFGLSYQEARSLPRMNLDAQFMADMFNSGAKFEQLTADFSPQELVQLEEKIAQLRGTYMQPAWSADSAVNMMGHLRETSADLMRSDSSIDRKLGFVQREMAQAFEDRLWRHATAEGKPEMAARFQESRKKLAQMHVWEDAANFDTGFFSSRGIVAQRSTMATRVDPFTDELKMVADSAGAFPQSFQDISRKGGTMPISVFERYMLIGSMVGAGIGETVAGGGGAITGASVGTAIAGSGIAGRALATSKLGQR